MRVKSETILKFISLMVLNLLMIAFATYYAGLSPYMARQDGSLAVLSQMGSRGEEVRQIQQKLKQWAFYKGSVDGIFGQQTKDAVVRFQRARGLTPDGIAGPQTLRALGIQETSSGGSGSSAGSAAQYSDLEMLARIASSEAQGEGHIGMVAVAAVVLNRVKHPSFPDTISSVIYEKGQFTPVTNGQFEKTPVSAAYDAARDAMSGVDPSGGALFFYNPQKTSDPWLHSRPVIVTIKNHRFCS